MLRSAALVASATCVGLAGCSLGVSVASNRGVLVVSDSLLFSAREILLPLWERRSPEGVRLLIRSTRLPSATNDLAIEDYLRSADVVDASTVPIQARLVPLDPALTARNFPMDTVDPSLLMWFRTGAGLVGLPLAASQLQFAIRPAALRRLGLTEKDMGGTFSEVLQTLVSVRSAATSAGFIPIAGQPWSSLRVWCTYVLGAGGRVSRGNLLDVAGMLGPTEDLVRYAQLLRWKPASLGLIFIDPERLARCVCAILAPDTAWLPPERIAGLALQPFPSGSRRRAVPEFSVSGVGLSPYAKDPAVAIDFITWLFTRSVQSAMVATGIPPVIQDNVLSSDWARWQNHAAGWYNRFDSAANVDVLSLLPYADGYNRLRNVPDGIDTAFAEAAMRMYAGSSVRSALAALARAVGIVLAEVRAGTALVGSEQ